MKPLLLSLPILAFTVAFGVPVFHYAAALMVAAIVRHRGELGARL